MIDANISLDSQRWIYAPRVGDLNESAHDKSVELMNIFYPKQEEQIENLVHQIEKSAEKISPEKSRNSPSKSPSPRKLTHDDEIVGDPVLEGLS